MTLFHYLIPDVDNNPIVYPASQASCMKLRLCDQLVLVLSRLRNGLHLKDLAFRINIRTQIVSIIFNSWIEYMYRAGSDTYHCGHIEM